jgi:hypothetical protein
MTGVKLFSHGVTQGIHVSGGPAMKSGETLLRSALIILLGSSLAWGAKPTNVANVPGEKSVRTQAGIEADWLRQAELRLLHVQHAQMNPEADAAGGCDGIKDGKDVGYYGFHTSQEKNPWWQVDLGTKMPLARVVIFNGSTPADAKRALGLTVLLSSDGSRWTEVYRHNGQTFCGPKEPLTGD